MAPFSLDVCRTRAIVVIALVWFSAGPAGAPSAAAMPPSHALTAAPGAFDPVRRELAVTVRCNGPQAECRGRLRIFDLEDRPLTAERQVRLKPGRAYRLRFALNPGLRARERLEPEREVRLSLIRRGRTRTRERFTVVTVYSCRAGKTVALTAVARVFTIERVGLYACERPVGRPVRLGRIATGPLEEDVRFAAATRHRVAFVAAYTSKCPLGTVVIFDVRARRTVLQRAVSTNYLSPAHSCRQSGEVGSLVLGATGAAAWIETAGQDGRALVRVVGPAGDRIVDAAPDIDVGSLTLAEGSLRWLRGGEVRSAPLN